MSDEERAAFGNGYLIACCNLVNMHDLPELASDVLGEAGITQAEVDAMDLSEYDARALAKIRAARPSHGDPISEPARPKVGHVDRKKQSA